jgi:plastocyanin
MGLRFLVGCMLACSAANAAQIDGSITIQRRLTRRKVTLAASDYERGVMVHPGAGDFADALSFERAHVVVFLEGNLESRPVTAVMTQKNKEFVPDLLAISSGSTVSFPNLDPIFHNVFSLSKPREFDLGNYSTNKTRLVPFLKPGVVFVNCHLHPNMTGTIVITPNSFLTRSDENGHFTIADVPKGEYTVVAWHKAAGYFRQKVTVGDEPGAPVKFFIPLPATP